MSDDLRAWAVDRWLDICTRELDHSLEVGLQKPLGSQAFASAAEAEVEAARARARDGEIGTYHSTTPDATGRYWVYAWHVEGMQATIARHKLALLRAGWPLYPFEAIGRSRAELVKPRTPLFDAIADFYGDKTGPGRTDVFPALDPARLLEAFREAHGFDEPTTVYFRAATNRRRLRQGKPARR